MIILGIDPGSQKTGYGLIKRTNNKMVHVENGTIYLEIKKSFSDRLVLLYQEIQNIVRVFKPQVIVIENIFYHKNAKSIQKLGEVRGVAMLSGAISGLAVFEYTPLEVKKAVTGHGNASKAQVQYMIQKLLGLKDMAEENASDALGVAICHSHSDNEITRASKGALTHSTKAQELLKQASFYS